MLLAAKHHSTLVGVRELAPSLPHSIPCGSHFPRVDCRFLVLFPLNDRVIDQFNSLSTPRATGVAHTVDGSSKSVVFSGFEPVRDKVSCISCDYSWNEYDPS